MKRGKFILIFFCLFIVNHIVVVAQCPASIQLTQIPQSPVCLNTPVTFTVSPSAGGITTYVWVVNGDTVSNNPSLTTSINGAHVEIYAISDTCGLDTMYTGVYIQNVEMDADYNVIVEECNQPVADIQVLNVTGGQEPYSYNLYTSEGGQGQKSLYTDLPVSSYPLVIQDANGCEDTVWINMSVIECPPPVPTEAITPNDDGYNDTWVIKYINLYPNNEVFIYDRWGQRVYHKKEYDNLDGWGAKYLGGDMPVSTYYYVLKIKFEKQEEQVVKGAISVFR